MKYWNRILASLSAAAVAAAVFAVAPAAEAADGKKAFKKNRCAQCHTVDGKHRIGPTLKGIIGRKAASAEGFKAKRYSKILRAAGEKGLVWDEKNMDEFLKKPKKFLQKYTGMKGSTKMAYPGLKDDKKRAKVIEYLKANP